MRPIRFLIPLLALALAVVLALVHPLHVQATRAATRLPHVANVEPLRRHLLVQPPDSARTLFGSRVVTYARHLIGIPYSWGGSSPQTGFDCSGLVRFVYAHFGITLPHSSWGDLALGRSVSRRSLLPGDLVFFYGAGHVGIYLGGGRFIDAPHTGASVRISTMGEYSGYYGARRFG